MFLGNYPRSNIAYARAHSKVPYNWTYIDSTLRTKYCTYYIPQTHIRKMSALEAWERKYYATTFYMKAGGTSETHVTSGRYDAMWDGLPRRQTPMSSTCYGHSFSTYHCREFCWSCFDDYCGCFSLHCCCIKPVKNEPIPPPPPPEAWLHKIQRFRKKETTDRQETALLRTFPKYNCGKCDKLHECDKCKQDGLPCEQCAFHIHKGFNGPGFAEDGIRTLRVQSVNPFQNQTIHKIISNKMFEWLLEYSEVFKIDCRIVNAKLKEEYTTGLHVQALYKNTLLKACNLPEVTCEIVSSYAALRLSDLESWFS